MKIKSYAKVNIFLKIVGLRGDYHEIVSRFVRVNNLFDEMFFIPKKVEDFTIEGKFGCDAKKNTIYKAYLKLKKIAPEVERFFKEHIVKVDKKIPEFAGLGGGSSNAASFLLLANDVLDLNLSKEELSKIGEKIGADVPFFIYGYKSANVFGIGEIVKIFEEESLEFDIITPPVRCDTGKVYKKFRENLQKDMNILERNKELANILKELPSKEILRKYEAKELNDLFPPALSLCKDLANYQKDIFKDIFFSGSGSSFFRIKNG